MAANIALSLALFAQMGHLAIALATSVAGWLTLFLMLVRLWRRDHWRPGMAIAHAGGSMFCRVCHGRRTRPCDAELGALSILSRWTSGVRVVFLAGLVALGAAVFMAVCLIGGALRDVRALRDPAGLHRRQ